MNDFMRMLRAATWLTILVSTFSVLVSAQSTTAQPSIGGDIRRLPTYLLHDQYAIWTSPAHVKLKDATWLVPLGGIAAGLIATDRDVDHKVAQHTGLQSPGSTLSNGGLALALGSAGGFYLWGAGTHDDHKRETGFLATEAVINSLGVVEALKVAFRRERPEQNLDARFFQGGSSFPSGHAIMSFSVASVIASEYPGPATKVLAYGGATAISVARVAALKHSPADVFVGGTLGYLIGRQVYRAHHDKDLPGASWGTFEPDENHKTSVASTYVPLESWVYPAIERLAAQGYVETAFLGLRPWTRIECARLIDEAGEVLEQEDASSNPAVAAYVQLKTEFATELNGDDRGKPRAAIDRLYTRVTGISGEPVRDDFHFSRTIVNDYGRPFGEGANVVSGLSASAHAGPLAAYVTWEFQHAAQGPERPLAAGVAISQTEAKPVIAGNIFPEVNRGRLLDAYVSYNAADYQFSFGKQSLWWGPAEDSTLLFSNNAEPIMMFRIDRASPVKLPWIFGLLGPMRAQFFVGQLTGHQFVNTDIGVVTLSNGVGPQPFLNGQKVSFHPTKNFEFSVSRTGIFGGPRFPFTLRRFIDSLVSTGNTFGTHDPGDRRSSADFTYRIPGLRNWLTFYGDAMAEDEISPIGYPRRSAFFVGIYMPQLPGMRKLDFRAEGGYTDLPTFTLFPGFYYFNVRYIDGYTNAQNLMGSWIGREGRGVALSTRYWLSADSHVQFSYRAHRVDPDFLEGGALNDATAAWEKNIRKRMSISGSVQYEHWRFPLLAATPQHNVAVSIGVTYYPKRHAGD